MALTAINFFIVIQFKVLLIKCYLTVIVSRSLMSSDAEPTCNSKSPGSTTSSICIFHNANSRIGKVKVISRRSPAGIKTFSNRFNSLTGVTTELTTSLT